MVSAPIALSLRGASGIVDGEGTSVDVDGIVIAIRITVIPQFRNNCNQHRNISKWGIIAFDALIA